MVPATALPALPPAEGWRSGTPVAGGASAAPGAPRSAGRFERIEVNSGRLRAVPVCTAEGLPVRLVRR
ncbi:hypothetical protein [Streptomyces naphthomycinicus]|uniref:hypothetical protein n=1 Tax=Streptomyces naphthomycinicus TaxID=2872625 RepID=UPI001CEC371A|nr:hypothetical protein [Streptomyces sp. TML10]